MQLNLSNIGKIEEAEINIDGITVIAGENNAGKSTIGKLLFAIFNSMNDMDKKIEREKESKIYSTVNMLLQNRYMQKAGNLFDRRRKCNILAEKIAKNIVEYLNEDVDGDIEEYLQNYVKENSFFEDAEDMEDLVQECTSAIIPILNVSDQKVMAEVITRWFNRVFEDQISPLRAAEIESRIELTVKGKKLYYLFKDNICTNWESEFNVLHGAFYIDNPFVMDKMSDRFTNLKITESHLINYLCKREEDIYNGIFDVVMAKDKLNGIYNILDKVIAGDIEKNQDGEYCYKSNKFIKPLSVKNLSTGLKSFALIKKLIENGSIKEKDVLILDEPEIHLHPEWQLLYAELMVLLQKEFDLSMVITTHSPYFLDAIDVFSARYDTLQRTHYYLAENKGDLASLQDVTGNIDAIYKKLSDPMQVLENLRYGIH